MPRQILVKTKSFYVAKKIFLCRDKVSQGEENFCCNKVIWPRHKILGRDRVFSYCDQVWGKGQGILCHDKVCLTSRQKVPRHGVLTRDRDALSRRCGTTLRCDREGHARTTRLAVWLSVEN